MRLTILALALLALTGCETVKGAGRDLSTAGRVVGGAISGAAQSVENAL